ncbi:serine hydroxymethyltransferase 4-like [Syzygium oleosum]|uniref:serine hydroxymethyltransferase 4-like n=1 Tax=Syzygium oleosum TaxID=219896 RepID=UPI0011D1CC9A|nr:serine hydroxymethyltransferase 4-like [Syzygium oleosum]
MDPVTVSGTSPLQAVDPEIHDLIEKKKRQQFCRIELSPCEIFTSSAVDVALGYALTNNNSNVMPGNPHDGDDQFIDALKNLCRNRALQAFCLDPTCWGVDVQSYSGYTAKVAAYTAVLQPHSRIMGLNLPSGAHLTHGYNTSGSKKIYFESIPFDIDPSTGYINYDKLEEKALDFCPHLIICGSSAYPRDWDYARFRSIANGCGALLLCDMSGISGLVAAQEAANPFEYCEIVTTTTHKSSRGPTAGMILYRKGQPEDALYSSEGMTPVFHSLQGGPHNHQISFLAVSLKQAMSPEFKAYAKQVKANAVAVGNYLLSKGYKLVTGGTDNHLVLCDLRPLGLTGNKVEKLCNLCGITVNKNAIFGDSSAKAHRGVLIGTHAMTSRGLMQKDFEQIREFLHRAVTITSTIQKQHGKLMKDFNKGLDNNEDIEALKVDVEKFSWLH